MHNPIILKMLGLTEVAFSIGPTRVAALVSRKHVVSATALSIALALVSR